MLCPCRSGKEYAQCCHIYIEQNKPPELAEQLMRSRYTAYALGIYEYIVHTYIKAQRQQLSTQDIEESAQQQRWIKLEIHQSDELSNIPTVEFSAYYLIENQLFELREHSRFIKEDGFYKYSDGDILANKQIASCTRNDACPCDSGKKFKKCCGR